MSGSINYVGCSRVNILQPVGGTFFRPDYAKAIRDQFAAQVAHLPKAARPTLIVFEDPNGEKVPAEQTTDSLPV